MWDSSFVNADGNGWAGDASFATDKRDTKATAIGERLPVPVTITELNANLKEDEDKYPIGNYRFATVMVVGIVKSINNDNGTYTYMIFDPANPDQEFMVVKYSSDGGDEDSLYDNEIVEGTKVRAIGKLKGFGGTNTIMLFNISEVPDERDYKIFVLEARAAKLFFEKNVMEMMKTGRLNTFKGMLAPPVRRGDSGNSNASSTQDNKDRIYNNSSSSSNKKELPLQQKILEALKNANNDENGSHVDFIRSTVGNPDKKQLLDTLAAMIEEGFVYQTATEDYYAAI